MVKTKTWIALLAIVAMVMVSMLAGIISASAEEDLGPNIESSTQESTQVEATQKDPGVSTLAVGETAAETEETTDDGVFEALVREDTNENGIADGHEPLIDGVTIELYIMEPGGKFTPADGYDGPYQKVTGPGGNYAPWPWTMYFDHGWVGWKNLQRSYTQPDFAYYKVKMITPEGYHAIGETEYILPLRYKLPCYWYRLTFLLTPSESSCITGFKWYDKNADGVKQDREPLLSGWTIVLTRDGEKVATIQTDANGAYEFCDLEPGTYKVWEVKQRCWKQVYPLYGPCVRRPSCSYAKGHYVVEVEGGQEYTGRNFGNLKLNSCCAWWTYKKWLCRLIRSWF